MGLWDLHRSNAARRSVLPPADLKYPWSSHRYVKLLPYWVDRNNSPAGHTETRLVSHMRGLPFFELPAELQAAVVGHMPLRTMARLARTQGARVGTQLWRPVGTAAGTLAGSRLSLRCDSCAVPSPARRLPGANICAAPEPTRQRIGLSATVHVPPV